MKVSLTLQIEIDTFDDAHTPEDIEDALSRRSTGSPMDEVEGYLWSELHGRGIDSMVQVFDWEIRA